jgi:hypothetical protein
MFSSVAEQIGDNEAVMDGAVWAVIDPFVDIDMRYI